VSIADYSSIIEKIVMAAALALPIEGAEEREIPVPKAAKKSV
jgi:hypothetical protein